MNKNQIARHGVSIFFAVCALSLTLSGCGGSDGSNGAPGPGTASLSAATALNIEISKVTINSAPVVNFKVTNQDGVATAGLTLTDLRFTIAKLTPGANGAPSYWQNYINTKSSGLSASPSGGTYVRGNRENNGTLVDNKDGTYVYTFHTDITDTAQTCQWPPCVDADDKPIDTSYNPNLTHRLVIQTRGTLPMVNGIYTFRPSDGATTGLTSREIVETSKCNVCHNKLEAHDARIETQYCVLCHNPGSTANGTIGTVIGPTPVDFKVLIHKIHDGDALPSGEFGIVGFSGSLTSFKDVAFPQDIRNCTKCHDGADTAQGDNWKTQPSKAACSSCHDDVYFGTNPDPVKTYQTVSHIALAAAAPYNQTVGPDPDDGTCIQCHGSGQVADIAAMHTIPSKVLAEKYKFNLISVTGGMTPSIEFSVTDPTNVDPISGEEVPYDIGAGDATTNPAFKTPSNARLALDIAWNTTDFNNTGSGANPAQPISIDPVAACTPPGTGVADWVCTNVNNIFTLVKQSALPAGATGTGRVGFEGHPAGANSSGAYSIRVPIKSKVMDWSIDGSTVKARRTVVDVAKCDNCHDQLSLHGNNRTDEPQLCVICHNPNDTDASQRPKNASGILDGSLTADGLPERAIDFKRMIHSIHGAAVRTNPFIVYGYGGSVNNFSNLRFPGILNDCSTCHAGTSYQLTGIWEAPTQNGILATTISTTPNATDAASYTSGLATPVDDLKITPTAAVCSSCHDGATAKAHMVNLGGAVFDGNAAAISASYETCSVCHGPGGIADVKVVHSVP
jgi:OmcA/MtrC family decaheme c-type cytochrome